MSFLSKLRLYASILFDGKTPWYVKLLIAAGIIYLVVPTDFLPDHIPFLGLIDDLTIGAALIAFALRMVPDEIIDRHRKK